MAQAILAQAILAQGGSSFQGRAHFLKLVQWQGIFEETLSYNGSRRGRSCRRMMCDSASHSSRFQQLLFAKAIIYCDHDLLRRAFGAWELFVANSSHMRQDDWWFDSADHVCQGN